MILSAGVFMEKEKFEELVNQVIEKLPEEFGRYLENVDVLVADSPAPYQLAKSKLSAGQVLLGLYEGIPQTRRGSQYGNVLPDKITIFQNAIETSCRNDAELAAAIEHVVKHEIAHHFGISDDRLREIGRY
jgi:predicted Zn-dependent protease with MMP-like domain